MIKNKFNFNCIFRDDKILKITINKSIENIEYNFSIFDSYNILNNSLYKLSINFKVPIIKIIFFYDFSNKNNLFYINNIPDIIYFK